MGFNFVPRSKRYITPALAKELISILPESIAKVGIFQNEKIEVVNKIADDLNLSYIQLHGNETPEYCRQIKNKKIIKTFKIDKKLSIGELFKKISMYNIEYYLLDRETQGGGEMVDINIARLLAKKYKIFLAGGLNPENVSTALSKSKPFAVDVASGIETDGVEDESKIKKFVLNAKGVNL